MRCNPRTVSTLFALTMTPAVLLGSPQDGKPAAKRPGKAAATPALGHEWPQWRGPSRDGVWRETGILESLPDDLSPRWVAPVGSGYSGPTVAGGRVFVMDRIEVEDKDGAEKDGEDQELERVHCFAWESGEKIWSESYPCAYRQVSYKAGPRCSVLVAGSNAFSLGTMGHLHCFDAATGKIRWKKDLGKTYSIRMPIWGIAASPILEDGLLIVPVSGKDAYLVAFDARTGEEKWKSLSDRGNYSAPIVVEQADKRVLVSWTGDRIVGVDPGTGSLHWSFPFRSSKMPLGVASPVLHGDKLFFTGFYDGSLALRLLPDELAVAKIWQRRGRSERATDGLHSTISTPEIRGEHIYGVDSYGELRCLKLADGTRVWEDRTAVPRSRWATIHFVKHGRRTWMFNERGELILAELSPTGFQEIDRAKLIEPTREQLNRRGGVCWSHPAFAYRHIFVRNDEKLACFSLAAKN